MLKFFISQKSSSITFTRSIFTLSSQVKHVLLMTKFYFGLFNMGQPRPLFRLFSSFQTKIPIFTTNKCEQCPSSIRRWYSNPQHLDNESPPITTRPGLIAHFYICAIYRFGHFRFHKTEIIFIFSISN